jgi:hypothetical protein
VGGIGPGLNQRQQIMEEMEVVRRVRRETPAGDATRFNAPVVGNCLGTGLVNRNEGGGRERLSAD